MGLRKLTQAEFEQEVEGGRGQVVVDFFAEWCGPCHQVAPELERLAAKWDGSVRFVKLDIDENPEVATKYGVFSIPTIVLFVDGDVAATTMGAGLGRAIEHDLGLSDHAA
ncbi:MAG: thioredoxin [Actinomycetota bacterium]